MNLVFFTMLFLFFNTAFLHAMNDGSRELNGLTENTQQLLQSISGKGLLSLVEVFKLEDIDAGIQRLALDKHAAYRTFLKHVSRRQLINEENNDQESLALGQDVSGEQLEQELLIALFCKMSAVERESWRRRDDSSGEGWCMAACGAIGFIAGIWITVWYAVRPC